MADGTGRIDVPGQRSRLCRILGRFMVNAADPGLPAIAEGRMLTEAETRQGAGVAVVSSRLAAELRRAGVQGGHAGERISVGGRTLQVVGILSPSPREQVFTVVTPTTIALATMDGAQVHQPRTLAVRAGDVQRVKETRVRVEQFAAAHPAWRGKYTVVSYGADRLAQVAQSMLVLKMLMGAFTGISLLVGAIGIMNVLLSSIMERTREIGVRKAVGARRRDVLLQFLVESTTISVAGAMAGLVVGVSGAFLVTAIIRARTQAPLYAAVTWQTLTITLTVAVVIGMMAGIYPARRASRLTVIDAIQRE